MRVLLIWWSIPEDCDVYLLEGKPAELALELSGRYIGFTQDAESPSSNNKIEKKLDQLSIALEGLEPVLPGQKQGATLDLAQFTDCQLVFSGFCM